MKTRSRQLLDSVDQALKEVDRRLASGEMDGSGRYFTEKQLTQRAARERLARKSQVKRSAKAENPAA
jgi:hypothetical protein